MTLPSRRNRRTRGRSHLTLTGDFPGHAQDITEELARIRTATWDGTTIDFSNGGASSTGLPPGAVYAAPVAEDTQPIPPLTPQPRPRPRDPLTGDLPLQDINPRHDTIGRDTARGWPHLTEIRCAYPAAASATPIPCDSKYTADAPSFRDQRRAAYAAGWHLDDLGRMVCPRCARRNPGYRSLYPLTLWDPDAFTAAQAGDQDTENWFRAAAELGLLLDVRAVARAKHRAGTP